MKLGHILIVSLFSRINCMTLAVSDTFLVLFLISIEYVVIQKAINIIDQPFYTTYTKYRLL